MGVEPTGLAKTIDAFDLRTKLDANAKKLVKHRIILAWILKECVSEFKDLDVSYIEKNCFAGEVKVSTVSVDQDRPDADSSINGSDTVDTSETEGEIRFDIVFDAVVPDTNETIRVIINIEIQDKTDLKYSLVTRGIYYGSRLVSKQKGTVFKNQDYQNIQKVYSIWICPSPKKKDANSIVKYGIMPKEVVGNASEESEKNYDKMDIIIISLNDKVNDRNKKTDCNDIVRLLSALLSTDANVQKRKKIMDEEFGIPMTKEIEEEVENMCNLGYAIETKGFKKGEKKGRKEGKIEGIKEGRKESDIEHIRALMKNLNITPLKAMDMLNVPEKERADLLKELEGRN